MDEKKQFIMNWAEENKENISEWHQIIWNFAEPAWREYRSAKWYVDFLRNDGWKVEEGSGGMPTAFCATWSNGEGPTIGGYAEYDATPENCQAADTKKRPREGMSEYAAGHTDPHSALGIGSLSGFLAAKAAMQKYNIPGKLKLMGEPAEKVRGAKPIHAAKGYYDDMDAAISYHPFFTLTLANTTIWDTHVGAAYSIVYTFKCDDPETWMRAEHKSGSVLDAAAWAVTPAQASVRCPGATEAVIEMHNVAKKFKEHLVPTTIGGCINETILTLGQATSDNQCPRIGQILIVMRVQDPETADKATEILDRNAESIAKMCGCTWEKTWVSKSRQGLPNHTLAAATFENFKVAGAPQYSEKAQEYAREIQKSLGLEPMDRPLCEELSQLQDPIEAEKKMRLMFPADQIYFTSDDYADYTWQTPTVRMYNARPALKVPSGYVYPAWVSSATGGIPEMIDPTMINAAQIIGMTIVDLLTKPEILKAAREEFNERTGGGIGGTKWVAPLCDYEPPVDLKWPEYVTTQRGEMQWCIPAKGDK